MVSRATIEMNYKKTIQQADQIESVAAKMNLLANSKFDGTMYNISMNWKGDSASLYLQKGEQLRGNINRTTLELRMIAQEIKAEAKRLYQADIQALEIIQG